MDWRALTAADTPAWSALTDAVAAVDDTGERYPADALAEELAQPGARSLGVFDGSSLVAAGQVLPVKQTYAGEVRTYFMGTVDPSVRGRGIGGELFDRLEAMAVDAAGAAFPGRDVRPSTQAYEGAASARALIESRGYQPVRYFHQMEATPTPAFRNPRLQRYRPALDDAIRDAHLTAFADHWDSAPKSDEEWRADATGSTTFRPQFSTVAATIDGRVDGYVLSYQFEPDSIELGAVGVRPEVRGRGLGRKLLDATLAEIAAAGIPRAVLYVDSENAHGAGRLYESVGFTRRRTVTQYRRG